MPASSFDTNILIYIATTDRFKADCAEKLLRQGGYVSVQTLNEITNVLRRKFGASWAGISTMLQTVRAHLELSMCCGRKTCRMDFS